MKQIGIWVGVTLIIILSVVGLVALSNVPAPRESTKTGAKLTKSTENDIVFGNKDAKVVLIEYADFECPACARYYPIVKQLKEDYKDKMIFVYRYFPLRQIHTRLRSHHRRFGNHHRLARMDLPLFHLSHFRSPGFFFRDGGCGEIFFALRALRKRRRTP